MLPMLLGSFLNLYSSQVSTTSDTPQLIGDNLVKNGGFEMGNKHWVGNINQIIGSHATDLATEGKNAFLYKKKPNQRGWLSVYQNIALEPGKTYSVSAKVYAPLSIAFGINLNLTENNNTIYNRGLRKDANAMEEWQYVEVFVQIPDDLKSPKLKLSMNGGNSKNKLLLDDVRVYEIGNPETVKNIEKIKLFTGDIKMKLKEGAYPSPLVYSGDNSTLSKNFSNYSKYYSDILFNSVRKFGGFSMKHVNDTVRSRYLPKNEAQLNLFKQIIKDDPLGNPILNPEIIEDSLVASDAAERSL